MKKTFKNNIKMIWHCLINKHRATVITYTMASGNFTDLIYFCCDDCNYGEDKYTVGLKGGKQWSF